MYHLRRIRSILLVSLSTIRGGIRDRILQALGAIGVFLIFSTGVFSSFSMRQPVEVAVNYSLSVFQIVSIMIALFIGLNLISNEIDSKANHPILTQPISRSTYLLGKFIGFTFLMVITVLILGIFACIGLWLASAGVKTAPRLSWANFIISIAGSFEACVVLGAVVILFTSFATSSILPFLMSCVVYAIGQSTQSVLRYINSGMAKTQLAPSLKFIVKAAYYVFPNFALFDFKAQAIYALKIPAKLFALSIAYGLSYVLISIFLAIIIFEKRDLP